MVAVCLDNDKKRTILRKWESSFFMDVFWQKEDVFDCLSYLLRFDVLLQPRVRRNGNG